MEAVNVDRLFVVTGGPGSGKSTLIAALAGHGIRSMPEAGRAIIQDQVAIGGEALPWSDRRAFAELMLSWEIRSYRAALRIDGPVIFDRGVPDVAAYLRLSELPVPAYPRKGGANVSLSSACVCRAALAGNLRAGCGAETVFRRSPGDL